jgi:ribosomal protein S6
MQDEELRQEYEVGFLIKTETDRAVISQLLAQHGATVLTEGPLRLTTLSYTIEKLDQAIFGWIRFSSIRTSIPALEHDLKMSPVVVRFLLVKAEPIPEPRSQAPAAEDGNVEVTTESESAPSQQSLGSTPMSNEDIEKKIEEILK